MTNKKFYITAAIPYVNAEPHIGHALEFVQTNTIARYRSILGYEVKTTSGGDENALKNVQAAEKEGVPIQEFVDTNTEKYKKLAVKLNAEFSYWQKGSSIKHHKASQKLWNFCERDIYKKEYTGLYCLGCEVFYSSNELNDNGECFEHPGKKVEKVSEENYFFRLSNYEKGLIELISSDKLKIIPKKRKNEALNFIKSGLQDISISRSNKRAKNWGVPVPGDNNQRMYVWFDALNIYQSAIGFGSNKSEYAKYWPADLHVIGKGILRFHAVYWPAFLISAGLKLPKAIFVHDYFTIDGQKMSKTLGNVINPINLIEKYGVDPLRYYLLRNFSPFTDGDFSQKKLQVSYNADLANGLGNLVARVAKLGEITKLKIKKGEVNKFSKEVSDSFAKYRFDNGLKAIWKQISTLDKIIDDNKLWVNPEKKKKILLQIIYAIRQIAFDLKPFLPETAKKIEKRFQGPFVKKGDPLFPRI